MPYIGNCCFRYYTYLIQALFMLILELLLFFHCTSYHSDSLISLLYSLSGKNPTTFTISPAYENLE